MKLGSQVALYTLEEYIKDNVGTFFGKFDNPDATEEQREKNKFMCAGHLEEILSLKTQEELTQYIDKTQRVFEGRIYRNIVDALKNLASLSVLGTNDFFNQHIANDLSGSYNQEQIIRLTVDIIRDNIDKTLESIPSDKKEEYTALIIGRSNIEQQDLSWKDTAVLTSSSRNTGR